MALIKCPECSNENSDKATSCPKCGHPLQPEVPPLHPDLDALNKQRLSREGAGLDTRQYVERVEVGLPRGMFTEPSAQVRSPVSSLWGVVCLFIVISGGVVLACVIGVFLQDLGHSGSSPAAASTVADTVPPARLSADDLYSNYKDNEVSADGRYKGKVVVVTGVIRDIGKDILDSPYVVIGGEGFLDGVQCMFARTEGSPVAHVSKGQRVAVRGRVAGKMGNVLLRECQFQ